MQRSTANRLKLSGFSFAEVCVAIVICVVFGAAAFTTNQRLLLALKNQKETTAATTMLQERMEEFRSLSYSNVADKTYVHDNILTFNPAPSPSPSPTPPPGGIYTTFSEAPLANLKETVTVSGYLTASGGAGYPSDGSHVNQWIRDMTGNGQPALQDHNDTLATAYDLLKVDIVLTWSSTDGRLRTREAAGIFGKGNIGQ
jgi:type II secretory pathway pseudopilin PulG